MRHGDMTLQALLRASLFFCSSDFSSRTNDASPKAYHVIFFVTLRRCRVSLWSRSGSCVRPHTHTMCMQNKTSCRRQAQRITVVVQRVPQNPASKFECIPPIIGMTKLKSVVVLNPLSNYDASSLCCQLQQFPITHAACSPSTPTSSSIDCASTRASSTRLSRAPLIDLFQR